MAAQTDANWHRLGAAIARRRTALGMSQAQVNAAGGPSIATQRLLENALADTYRDATLRQVEQGLRWRPGSVAAILAGGDPQELPDGPVIQTSDSSDESDVQPVIVVGLPDSARDLSPTERDEITAAATAAALRVWREIRSSR